jgi:signal transduction histidine kinase
MGLSSALKWYAEEFSRRSRIYVNLEMPPEIGRMNPEIETAIFRIVQESLTNIHRHSGGRNVRISLESDSEITRMTITDDGRGIAQDRLELIVAGQAGVGTAGMRERVKQLNGIFQIESDHRGTKVQVAIPRCVKSKI